MKPISLYIEDFFSHNKSTIKFDGFASAVIVGVNRSNSYIGNGIGKSAIFEAIRYALFNKTRKKRADDIVRDGKNVCLVEFTFKTNEREYKIARKRDRRVGEAEVALYVKDDAGLWSDISGTTPTLTNKKITDAIGIDHDVFINSVCFNQNDVSVFADATAGKKKEILQSLLKIDVWEDCRKNNSTKLSEFKSKYADKELEFTAAAELVAKKEAAEQSVRDIAIKRRAITRAINTIDIEKTDIERELFGVSIDVIKDLKGQLKAHKVQLSNIYKQHKDDDTYIAARVRSNNILAKRNDRLKKVINTNRDLLDSLEFSHIAECEKKVKAGREDVGRLKLFVENYKVNAGSDTCMFCESGINKKTFEERNELKLSTSKAELVRKRSQLAVIEKQLKAELFNKDGYDTAVREIDQHKKDSVDNNKDIRKNKQDAQVAEGRMKSYEDMERRILIKTADIEMQIKSKESVDVDGLEATIADGNKRTKKYKQELSELDISKGRLKARVEECIAAEGWLKKLKAEIKELAGNIKTHSRLNKIFGKDGIPAVIMENVSDELEGHTNAILSKICNEATSIKIETKRRTSNGSFVETFDFNITIGGRQEDFSGLSGGEKFRVAFAFRVALSKVLADRMGSKVGFLLLDEVTPSLDKAGVKMFMDAVNLLEKEFKVLIITHDENIQDSFQHVITVEKGPQGATVKQ